MKPSKLNQWLKKIQASQTEEISCSECFERLDAYVDLELAGQDPEKLLPGVKAHLFQCRVCQEEYELLRELAQADASEDSPPDASG